MNIVQHILKGSILGIRNDELINGTCFKKCTSQMRKKLYTMLLLAFVITFQEDSPNFLIKPVFFLNKQNKQKKPHVLSSNPTPNQIPQDCNSNLILKVQNLWQFSVFLRLVPNHLMANLTLTDVL